MVGRRRTTRTRTQVILVSEHKDTRDVDNCRVKWASNLEQVTVIPAASEVQDIGKDSACTEQQTPEDAPAPNSVHTLIALFECLARSDNASATVPAGEMSTIQVSENNNSQNKSLKNYSAPTEINHINAVSDIHTTVNIARNCELQMRDALEKNKAEQAFTYSTPFRDATGNKNSVSEIIKRFENKVQAYEAPRAKTYVYERAYSFTAAMAVFNR